jgi:hypothetical protein
MKHRRLSAFIVLALAGCTPQPPAVDWSEGAASCLSETIAAYEGKTYAEMRKTIGQQDVLKYRKHGHAYEVLVTVSPDVEHPPDGIQIDFDVFDNDDAPTKSPTNRTIYLQTGQTLHAQQDTARSP